MASGVQVHKAYVVNTYHSKEIVGWYGSGDLARRVVSFLTECSWGRVPNDFGIEERTVETVAIEAGRVLVRGKNLTRVLATFDPESCIAFVERLESKVVSEPAAPAVQLNDWIVEEKKIWRVQTKSLLSGKSEHFGFYASKELAQRVEKFARDCAFGRLSGGIDILAEEDPYQEDCLRTQAGWRLKGLPQQGVVHYVEEEFNPKACIDAVQAMVKTDKKRKAL